MPNRVLPILSELAEAHRTAKKYAKISRVLSRGRFETADLSKLGIILHLADQVERGIVFESYEKPESHADAQVAVRDFPGTVIAGLGECADRTAQWRTY